jgi:vacuolar-type H+-ATPase subunit E/Vma4
MNLGPVRSAALARATFQAAARVAAARADAGRLHADAKGAAQALLLRAGDEGRRDADAATAQAAQEARQAARALLLATHRTAEDDLRDRVQAAVLALRADPDYPAMCLNLAQRIGDRLGPGTEIVVDPRGDGGVAGRSGARHIEASLVALAEVAATRASRRLAEQLR